MSGKHEHTGPDNARRGFLRGAVTAVGAAAAGGATAAIASPQAAGASAGDPMNQGAINDAGVASTTIQSNGPATTLKVQGGLRLIPTAAASLPTAPHGIMAVDEFGDVRVAGDDFAGGSVLGTVPSSSWASMTMPIKAMRILDTRVMKDYSYYVKVGASGVTGGRLGAGKTITLSLEMPNNFFYQAFPAIGIQANLTVVNTTGSGHITVWGDGPRPATSSINFDIGYVLSNFIETPTAPLTVVTGYGVLPCGAINIYTTSATSVIIDLVAIVAPLPISFSAQPPSGAD